MTKETSKAGSCFKPVVCREVQKLAISCAETMSR